MRRGGIAALLLSLVVLLSGCSLDVEAYLRPPIAEGEQQSIHAALDRYLGNARYVLQYPSDGAYTSAFVVCDANGNPTDSASAESAVVFYTLSSAPDNPHIHLLFRRDGIWESIGDLDGFGNAILQIAFGDLDGDGMMEVITGWNAYSGYAHHLVVFSAKGGLSVISDAFQYTRFFVGNMMTDGRDDVVLVQIGGADDVTATLIALDGNDLVAVDTVALDGSIRQFGSASLGKIKTGVPGMFIEAIKSTGVQVTELVYFARDGLHAPFHETGNIIVDQTARLCPLDARDIDGDGYVEIPTAEPLNEYSASADTPTSGWLTVWRRWNVATGHFAQSIYTVVNPAEGLYVELGITDASRLTGDYNETLHLWTLYDTDGYQPILRLRTGEIPAGEQDSYVLLLPAQDGLPPCYGSLDGVRMNETDMRECVHRFVTKEDGRLW